METAFAYARVSTKKQEAKDNSIPAQFSKMEKYCAENDIKILRRYHEAESAYKGSKRDQFDLMISDALKDYPDYIITDDSSRFSRNKNTAVNVKSKLREYGVNIRFVNEPYMDPNTISGLWMEGIQELLNQSSSMQTAYHVKKGMGYNICNRDEDTGWCYKNGGVPSYGYKNEHVLKGNDSSNKRLLKSVWILDEVQAPIVREIIIEMRLQRGMSYSAIRDDLNRRGIKTNRNQFWSNGSVSVMFKKHRLMTYAGYAIWNRINTKNKRNRVNAESDWEVAENAHEAIISEEEMNQVLALQKSKRRGAPSGGSKNSPFLFTGYNYEQEKMFVCKHCGSAMVGDQNRKANFYKYVCGSYKNKGKLVCDNSMRIDRDWIEEKVVTEIKKKYADPETIEKIIKEIKGNLKNGSSTTDKAIADLDKKIRKDTESIRKLLDAIKSGVDPELIKDEINSIKKSLEEAKFQKQQLESTRKEDEPIDEEELRSLLSNFGNLYDNANEEQKRQLIRTFVRRLELDTVKWEVSVEFYDDTLLQAIQHGEPYHKRTKNSTELIMTEQIFAQSF